MTDESEFGDRMEMLYFYKRNPIVLKIFLTLLVPTILMNLTTAIASFADAVIIGMYLDDLSLSVVTFATPIYMVINTFAALFAVGGSVAMGIDAGKADKESANKVFSISIELLVFVSLVLLFSGVFFGKQITLLLGAGPEVFDMVYDYSMIVLLGAPIFMLNVGLAFFVRNDGNPVLSMAGMFTSIVSDIILNFVFIGVCGMGVIGAALSTVIGQLLSVIVISSHFFTRKNTLRFKFAVDSAVFRIIKNGASAALHFVYQFITVLLINHLLSNLAGPGAVVVYTVVFNLYTVSLAVFEGMSQTVQPMISVYFGEKSYGKIKNTLRLAVIATFIICGLLTVVLELFPEIVPAIFGISDITLIGQSATAVRIYAVSMIIMTLNVIIGYYLQSTENNFLASVFVSLRCLVLFVASVVILGVNFGLNGIWASYTVAEVLSFVCILLMVIVKKHLMKESGKDADIFLLDKTVQNLNYCYTCIKTEEFEAFCKELDSLSVNTPGLIDGAFSDMKQYLEALGGCIKKRTGEIVEVEINLSDRKIIVRDNLSHDEVLDKVNISCRFEYGPVLGWNRICIEEEGVLVG